MTHNKEALILAKSGLSTEQLIALGYSPFDALYAVKIAGSSYEWDDKSGYSITWENALAQSFMPDGEHALSMTGNMEQNGTPTPASPIPIQCVKAGTKIRVSSPAIMDCISEVITSYDLHTGDIWYPVSGMVVRSKVYRALTGTETWSDKQFTGGYGVSVSPTFKKYAQGGRIYCNILQGGHTSLPSVADRNGTVMLSGSTSMIGFGTKDVFATVAEWQTYLAAQYAAGTPVYVVYDLATPIVEQYAPQPMAVPRGNVSLTQTALDLQGMLFAGLKVRT